MAQAPAPCHGTGQATPARYDRARGIPAATTAAITASNGIRLCLPCPCLSGIWRLLPLLLRAIRLLPVVLTGCRAPASQRQEHVSPTEHDGTASQARTIGSADTIDIRRPQRSVHRVTALSDRSLADPSKRCLAMQRAFASGACKAIQVSPSHEDTCHCPCISSTATSVLPALPDSDITAGMQCSGACAQADIGTSRTIARKIRLTRSPPILVVPPSPPPAEID